MKKQLIIAVVITLPWLPACRGGSDDSARASQAPTPSGSAQGSGRPSSAEAAPAATTLPAGEWRDLARRLVDAKDLESALRVTREVLARGGVATADGDRVIVAAMGPVASFSATPLETLHLAMEARKRATAGRLTAADLAQMLESFGWPFPGGRPGGGDANAYPTGRPSDPEAMRRAELAAREASQARERSSDEQMEAAAESERLAGRARVEAAQQKVREATDAWQRARQAVGKAPAGEKAAAEAAVQAALAARLAAIEQVGVARKAEDDAERDRRTRASRSRDTTYQAERVARRIGPDFAAGEKLMEMLAVWVRGAAEDPANPRSFTPLFLAEMARLQDPPVDLLGSRFDRPGRREGAPVDLRGGPRSAQLRLTLLEVQLIAAAFRREPARSVSLPGDRRLRGEDDVVRVSLARGVQDPCFNIRKTMEEIGKKLGGQTGAETLGGLTGLGLSEAAGKALEKAVAAITDVDFAEGFGKAMSAIGSAAKIAKLAAFYADGHIAVSVDPAAVHKPVGPNELVLYKATAGVSDEDWAEYERLTTAENAAIDRATRDCLDTLGMPRLTNVSDLAKEAEEWLVDWALTEGSPQHAYFSLGKNDFFLPGRRAMKLVRSGKNSASANFVVDILPEEKHEGRVVRAYVTARASLDATSMPSLGTLVNPIKGVLGLVDSLVELGAGWFQYMNMPKAYGTIEVEYHCPKPATLHQTEKPIGDGAVGDGPTDCLIAAGKG